MAVIGSGGFILGCIIYAGLHPQVSRRPPVCISMTSRVRSWKIPG